MSWRTITLGEICDMYQPKTITSKELITDGEYFVYGANGIIGKYSSFNHESPQLVVIPPFCTEARSRTVMQPWPVAAWG